MKESEFSCRVANKDDIASITDLMMISIEINMQEFLSPEQIEANKESMGVDLTLIEDGSYFVVEASEGEPKPLVGCGGWSKRRTLFGGKHTRGRDDSFSDPQKEPARIRAMYTHPDWTRRGIGTLLLQKGEQAAREAGFKEIELGSTIPGEPLYLAQGYSEVSREKRTAANGHDNIICLLYTSPSPRDRG